MQKNVWVSTEIREWEDWAALILKDDQNNSFAIDDIINQQPNF